MADTGHWTADTDTGTVSAVHNRYWRTAKYRVLTPDKGRGGGLAGAAGATARAQVDDMRDAVRLVHGADSLRTTSFWSAFQAPVSSCLGEHAAPKIPLPRRERTRES